MPSTARFLCIRCGQEFEIAGAIIWDDDELVLCGYCRTNSISKKDYRMPNDVTNAACDKCGGRVAIHTMAMCGVCKQTMCEECLGDHFEPEKVAASLTKAKLEEQAK